MRPVIAVFDTAEAVTNSKNRTYYNTASVRAHRDCANMCKSSAMDIRK